jgi:Putative sensor
MIETRTLPADSAIDRIFGPVIHAQTWINMLYLLISFPLGVATFVVLMTMFSTGVGLLPVFVGLFILWFALLVVNVLSDVYRTLVNTTLGAGIPARPPGPQISGSVFQRMLATVKQPGTLKRIVYLFVMFPIGIVSLVLVMTLLPLSVMLLTLPLTYTFLGVTVGTSRVTTFDEAIYLCCFGAVFTLLSVHVLNSWAGVCRRFAQSMLG